MPLDPLATPEDVQAGLDYELTTEQMDALGAILDRVSAVVRAEAGQEFTVATTTARFPVKKGHVRLTQRPVTAVSAVKDTNGNDMAFTWLGADRVCVAANVFDSWSMEPWRCGIQAVDVTYQHGFAEVPGDVVAVVCQMAGRTLGTPATDSGVTQETTGSYSYTVGAAAGAGAAGLLPDERLILSRYRRSGGTVLVTP